MSSLIAPDRFFARIVLVADLADDLLDQVLERDDAVEASELVDDDGDLEADFAQLGQQRVEFHRRREPGPARP